MEKIKLRLAIRKLQKLKDQNYNEYLSKRKNKTGLKLHELSHEYQSEDELLQDEISELYTKYFCKKAAKLIIPMPEQKSCWCESKITGLNYLSTHGIHEMKKMIREENFEKKTWITLIVGLLGAFSGAVSVWRTL